MTRHAGKIGFVAAGVAMAAGSALGQTPLNTSGQHAVGYIGHSVQDFTIPNVPGGKLQLIIRGADGGDANGRPNACAKSGGEGATILMNVRVDYGPFSLRPGGRLRFIVGEAGQNASDNDDGQLTVGGGGGGGSGILYEADQVGDDWIALAVAGGGGGAIIDGTGLGFCSVKRDGQWASLSANGTDGGGNNSGRKGVGGTGGLGGGDGRDSAWDYVSGGGGGLFGDGLFGWSGGTTAKKGYPAGGAGGAGRIRGGWGCGGGGGSDSGRHKEGGGGGGGYSGGGGGQFNHEGGGGGSWFDASYGTASILLGNSGDHGAGSYEFTSFVQQPTSFTDIGGVSLNGPISLHTFQSNFNTVLGLYTEGGELLAENDNSPFAPGLTSVIDTSLDAGTYYLFAGGSPRNPAEDFVVPSAPSPGGTLSGAVGAVPFSRALNPNDSAWYKFRIGARPTGFIDAGVIGVSGSTTLQIDRQAFDMVLGLYDNSGQLLSMNDDDPDFNIESRIVRDLDPGVYFLSVTEFGDTPGNFFTFDSIDNERFGPTVQVKV
ncbi:MAG: hypothetical protein AAFQ71_11700, partial [Planctomycetota bacterium]